MRSSPVIGVVSFPSIPTKEISSNIKRKFSVLVMTKRHGFLIGLNGPFFWETSVRLRKYSDKYCCDKRFKFSLKNEANEKGALQITLALRFKMTNRFEILCTQGQRRFLEQERSKKQTILALFLREESRMRNTVAAREQG
mmetsp:Transcript_4175/g.8715  ORF Transcript_4175/g.8715 Transcript_4175/m.8715 type:complete len:140 (+) Transcript_4175:437-856(+)